MRDIANYRISAFILHTFLFNNLLTLSVPAINCAGQIPTCLQTEISQKQWSKHCFYKKFFKEYLTSFLTVYRLIDFALVVL